MGDKRYYYNIFDDGTEYIEDYWGNEHYFNLDDVEELLNEQQSTIEQLQKENKQLQKELNNCEKFRYTVFKRIKELW